MAYIKILKLKMVLMVLVVTYIGFFLASRTEGATWSYFLLFSTLLGCSLAAAGALVLNQYLEKNVDAKMDRTKRRPVVTGAISPFKAVIYGTALVLAGVFLLFFQVNVLSAFLVLLIAFLYVLVYTPLKQITWLNTPIGAIPGAIPPMVGWAAVTGQVGVGAWILFFILFLWQHPHFYAIAWIYREDYKRGGFKMLSVIDPKGTRLANQTLFFAFALVPTSLLLSKLGITGEIYFTGALFLGLILLTFGVLMAGSRTVKSARRLLHASLVYLPLILVLILIDAKI